MDKVSHRQLGVNDGQADEDDEYKADNKIVAGGERTYFIELANFTRNAFINFQRTCLLSDLFLGFTLSAQPAKASNLPAGWNWQTDLELVKCELVFSMVQAPNYLQSVSPCHDYRVNEFNDFSRIKLNGLSSNEMMQFNLNTMNLYTSAIFVWITAKDTADHLRGLPIDHCRIKKDGQGYLFDQKLDDQMIHQLLTRCQARDGDTTMSVLGKNNIYCFNFTHDLKNSIMNHNHNACRALGEFQLEIHNNSDAKVQDLDVNIILLTVAHFRENYQKQANQRLQVVN